MVYNPQELEKKWEEEISQKTETNHHKMNEECLSRGEENQQEIAEDWI